MWSAIVSRFNKQFGKLKRSIVKRGKVTAMLASVLDDACILEIGGGYNPRYVKPRHPNVHPLDHNTAEACACERARLRAQRCVLPRTRRLIEASTPVLGGW